MYGPIFDSEDELARGVQTGRRECEEPQPSVGWLSSIQSALTLLMMGQQYPVYHSDIGVSGTTTIGPLFIHLFNKH